MKPLFITLIVALLSVGVIACGGGATTTVSRATSTPSRTIGDYDSDDSGESGRFNDADNDDIKGPKDRDGDADNSTGSYYDSDDDSIRDFGHAASAADQRAVTTLVKHYYTAAAADNGAAGCAVTYSTIAKLIREDQGHAPGPPYLRGNTCAVVMSKLFQHDQRQLKIYNALLRVTGVRLDHGHGFAVLGFDGLPGREIAVEREDGTWKIEALLDSELP
ncbi:MAG TPA: hypothetical protein VIJ39_10265 [Solirubrobacteraceae bacterium]